MVFLGALSLSKKFRAVSRYLCSPRSVVCESKKASRWRTVKGAGPAPEGTLDGAMPACSTQWQTGERGLQAGPRERGCAGFQRRATPLVGSWGEALRRYGRSPSAKLCPLQGRVPSNARYNPLYLAIRLLKRTDTRRVSISALLSQIRPYGAVAP